MTGRTLILRGLVFYRRTHLGVLLGAAISTMILVGALVVGDSVRHSLRRLALQRLGETELALPAGDRFVRAELADGLAATLDTEVAPVVLLRGVASAEGGQRRVNRVQIAGVDSRFWSIGAATDPLAGAGDGQVVVNRQLAARLGLAAGDEMVLRVERVDRIPGEVPFVSRDHASVAMRLTVHRVVGDGEFGRFSLRSNQVAPLTAFVPREALAKRMQVGGRANLLLAARRDGLTSAEAEEALAGKWQLADAALELRPVGEQGTLELVSERVFLDPPVEQAALAAAAARPVLTYFVNRISFSASATPYSFVAAPGEPVVPPEMDDDEIILNQWLADDLGAGPGDEVELSYWLPGRGQSLVEESAPFRVHSVVPVAGAAADASLMPVFPGLSDADSCRNWDPGIPVDLEAIRDKDEAYWDAHRGTPKAFVTLAAARRLWSNRFGALTGVRYPVADPDRLAAAIHDGLHPAEVGLGWVAVREQGLEAGAGATDFGTLFLSLSFFILAAALLLTGLLFTLGALQRAQQNGLLRAVGFSARQVRRLSLAEAGIIALAGSLLGLPCGIVYNQAVLRLLGSVWQGAVGTSALELQLQPVTLVLGVLLGLAIALATLLIAGRRQARQPVPELLGGAAEAEADPSQARPRRDAGIAIACVIAVLLILAAVGPGKGKEAAGAFWAAGFLMLAGCLAATRVVLTLLVRIGPRLGPISLGFKEAGRRCGRNLATVALLSFGVFVVVAVGANRHSASTGADERSSGTGGFAFLGESTLPIELDLNSEAGRRRVGLEADDEVRFVQLRRREGDDASCLNLNRVSQPSILAVDPSELAERGAFTFAALGDEAEEDNPWLVLDEELGEGVIPAVADQNVLVWGLGKRVGDELSYTDEHGNELRLRLVGGLAASVFQGKVIISEENFVAHFPASGGSHVLLVDVPPAERQRVGEALRRTMQDLGLELQLAAERLAELQQVENTYLTIFLNLGGLGLILGTVGLAVVLLRDVLEQRGRLAVLRAVGFSLAALRRMLLAQYLGLLAAGIACGAVSAVVAVLPALLAPGTQIPWSFITATLVALVVVGCGSVMVATSWATRGDLVPALRHE